MYTVHTSIPYIHHEIALPCIILISIPFHHITSTHWHYKIDINLNIKMNINILYINIITIITIITKITIITNSIII